MNSYNFEKKNVIKLLSLILIFLLVLIYLKRTESTQLTQAKVDNIIFNVLDKSKIVAELNFNQIYQNRNQFELLHPFFQIETQRKVNRSEVCPNLNPDKIRVKSKKYVQSNCEKGLILNFLETNEEVVKKQKLYEDIVQGLVVHSEDFIITQPLIHQNGQSYAFLLMKKGILPYSTEEWVKSHLSYFKLNELEEIIGKYKIKEMQFEILAQLKQSDTQKLIEDQKYLMTEKYFFSKNKRELGFSPLSYSIYPLYDVLKKIDELGYSISAPSESNLCLYRSNNICWNYNAIHLAQKNDSYLQLLVFSFVLLFLMTCILIFRLLNEKFKIHRKNKLSFQILSHEFRTPVSSLILSIRKLTENIDRFSDKDQDDILQISNNVYQLERILGMSRLYLNTKHTKIIFREHKIESLNLWIKEFVVDKYPNIIIHFLDKDTSFVTDEYWLSLVLDNLLKNAYTHGKSPFELRLELTKNDLIFYIIDNGKCEFNSLINMKEEFLKSNKSTGLGIGLSIVSEVLTEWNSQLQFKPHPTCFFFKLKRI